MGKSSKPPKQSKEEKNLLAQQTLILQQQLDATKQQQQQFDMLAPFLFKQLGLKATLDDKGQITGFTEIPNENKPLQDQAEKLLLQRSVDALEGKLPVSPQLQDELKTGRENLENTLRKSLGPDFAASSPGSRALSDFDEKSENILEAARRGDITLGEQLSQARSASTAGLNTQNLASLLGVQGAGNVFPQMLGGAASGFGTAAQLFQNSRQLGIQGSQISNQSNSGIFSGLAGIGSLAGTLALAPTTGGGSLFANLFT